MAHLKIKMSVCFSVSGVSGLYFPWAVTRQLRGVFREADGRALLAEWSVVVCSRALRHACALCWSSGLQGQSALIIHGFCICKLVYLPLFICDPQISARVLSWPVVDVCRVAWCGSAFLSWFCYPDVQTMEAGGGGQCGSRRSWLLATRGPGFVLPRMPGRGVALDRLLTCLNLVFTFVK